MADFKIKQIKTPDNTVHEIDAKYWDGYSTSDLKTINGKPILKKGNDNIDISITAADLGLSSAFTYCGVTTTEISDGSKTNPVVIGDINHTADAGCVVFYEDKAFVFNGTTWELLGDDITGLTQEIKNCVKNNSVNENNILISTPLAGGSLELRTDGDALTNETIITLYDDSGENGKSTIILDTYHEFIESEPEYEYLGRENAQIFMNGSDIHMYSSKNYDEEDGDHKSTNNVLSLNKDGLKYNDSPVVTINDVDNFNILKVDENGILNKDEVTIGTFEIKNDKPYNYTLEGRFYPYNPQCASGFKVVAHYDQKGVKYGHVIDSENIGEPQESLTGTGWYYDFVITDISFEGADIDGVSTKDNTLDSFLNRTIPILAAYIDNEYSVDSVDAVTFTDDVSEELSILYTSDNYISDVTFTRSAPFSLRHTSKALLNGSPVITAEMLAESDYVKSDNMGDPVTIQGGEMSFVGETINIGVSNTDYEKHLYINGDGLVYSEYDENRVEINGEGVKIKSKDIIDYTLGVYEYHEVVLSNKGVLTLDGKKIVTEEYRLEYTADESLGNYQPCNENCSKHEYDDETGKGVFIYNEAPTSIGDSAFWGCTSLKSVTIPDSITSIGYAAFRECTSLKSVTIPDSVTSIGNTAFVSCTSLISITIPNSVTEIGDAAFRECTSLISITIPNSVTSIGDRAFRECTSLTSITIPNSVTSIGEYTFYGCTSLTSITIPDSVTSIGWDAFESCTSLTSITIPDSVNEIGDYAFYCSGLESIIIPDSVTTIGCNAFEDSHLTSAIIGRGVTYIGSAAFNRNLLKNVYIKSIIPPTNEDSELFWENHDIETIYVPNESLEAYKSATNWSTYADIMVGSEILTLSDDSLIGISISLEERIKHLENIIEQIVITK